MAASVKQGTVIYRRWDSEQGLQETEQSFVSLDDLFRLCLDPPQQRVPDRVMLEGIGDDGARRAVWLVFQSASGHE